MFELFADDGELLSAYLDGELAEDELLHVRRLLASCSEHRRTVQQLEGLAAALSLLPRHRLAPDVAAMIEAQVSQAAASTTRIRSSDRSQATPRRSLRGKDRRATRSRLPVQTAH